MHGHPPASPYHMLGDDPDTEPEQSCRSFPADAPSRRTMLERLRRTLGDAPAVVSKETPRARAHPTDDARSIALAVDSDERMHTVTFARVHPQHGHVGALPPVPVHRHTDEDAGLIRPRVKMAAGSQFGGADFKAARRAKREGRTLDVGETVEMVGFMR